MKFRYTIEESSLNGAKDSRTLDFDKDEILIGRGASADVLLDSQLVSLSHAKVFMNQGRLVIEDLGSLSGVKVNGKLGQRYDLNAGDQIKIGDVNLKVNFEGNVWGFIEERIEAEKVDTEIIVQKYLKNLQVSNRIPSYLILSVILMAPVAVLFLVLPLIGSNLNSWSSGPISNKHRMIANDCNACHGMPFERIQDTKCQSCHTMSNHAEPFKAELIKQHPKLEVRCAVCHMEHNGDSGVISPESALCTNCHANIKSAYPNSKVQDVPNFEKHPEFSVSVQSAVPGPLPVKVRLSDSENLRDNSNVKLNHAKHLIKHKGYDQLNCLSCHEIAEDFRSIKPVKYEKHCQSCHKLTFDERLPDRQVPHGETTVVYRFLYSEYAKLFLNSGNDTTVQETFNIRRKPGGSIVENNAVQASEDFTRAFVDKQSRDAEKLLFTKTACFLCHRVRESDETPEKIKADAIAAYQLLTPQIPDRWMPDSIFSHGAHEEVSCEECHYAYKDGLRTVVRDSTKTNDVLLPRVVDCHTCHSQAGHTNSDTPNLGVPGDKQGKVKSECVMCHSFHKPEVMPVERKRTTKDILNVAVPAPK